MATKPNKQEFWSERRRKYIFGMLNKDLGYPDTMRAFLTIIAEKTLGFSKESDTISYSQINDIRKISYRQLQRLRRISKSCNLIVVKNGRGPGNLAVYSPQEDQSKWKKYEPKHDINDDVFNEEENTTYKASKHDIADPETRHTETQNTTRAKRDTASTDPTGFTGETREQDNAHPSDPEWGPPGSIQDNAYPNIETVAEQLREKMNENSMMGLGAATLEDARTNLYMLCNLYDVDPEVILRMADEWNERDWERIFSWECFHYAVQWDLDHPKRTASTENIDPYDF